MPTRRSGALFHAITRSTRPFKSTLAPYDTHQQPYPPHRIQPQQLHLGYMQNQPTRASAAMQCSGVVYWIRTRYAWPLQCTPALWCAAQAPLAMPHCNVNPGIDATNVVCGAVGGHIMVLRWGLAGVYTVRMFRRAHQATVLARW